MAAESKLQNRVINYLKRKDNLWYFKVHGGGIFQKSGIPDIIICYRGNFYGLELKAPGEKASTLQKAVGKQIKDANGYWLSSSDFDEIKEWIEGFSELYGNECYEEEKNE